MPDLAIGVAVGIWFGEGVGLADAVVVGVGDSVGGTDGVLGGVEGVGGTDGGADVVGAGSGVGEGVSPGDGTCVVVQAASARHAVITRRSLENTLVGQYRCGAVARLVGAYAPIHLRSAP